MHIRLHIGLFLLKLSYYLKRLYIVILKPRDLLESNKLQYNRASYLEVFSNPNFSLNPEEKNMLERYNIKKGKFLVLCCGGGRDSIALARAGFEVVGVDFVKGMIDALSKNAQENNLNLTFEEQDVTRLSFSDNSFDYAIISLGMYSSIPTRKLRIIFLKGVNRILRPNGLFIASFLSKNEFPPTYRTKVLKVIGYLTFGNRGYQSGDELLGKWEFTHYFHSKEEVEKEFEEAGFRKEEINYNVGGFSYAIARS